MAKKSSKKAATPAHSEQVGYDPKNREVKIQVNKASGRASVSKGSTGFFQSFADTAKARQAFDFQCACSQN